MTNPPAQTSSSRIGLILQQLDQLPTLPVIAMRVLQLASSDDASVKDVSDLIQADPALSTRILHLVHRADLGVTGEVTSIERAIKLLGFDAVRCAVLAVSVFATFEPQSAAPERFSRPEFWKHCIAVGCCAELLAIELKKTPGRGAVDPSEAFVAGLLHDIGKLALDAAIPKSFARVVEAAELLRGNIADIERNVIGIDHNIVGKRLAEQWQLPAALRDAIWLHGQLPQALPASARNEKLVNLITLADMLVREQHLGFSGNFSFPINRLVLMDALGATNKQVESVMGRLVEAVERRAGALGLGSTEAHDLYRQALQQANRELSRVTDQLASRNRKLSIRSKYFEALAAFQSELRPDAPPSVVLHAIGQTAATVLDAPAVAVFSMPPGVGYAEVSVIDRHGEVLQTQLVEMTESPDASTPSPVPQRPAPSDGPVLAVSPELEWIVQSFSPRLAAAGRFWICLEADGACIGGVVWGGESGEAQRLSAQAQELSALACGWSLALRTCQIRDEARALAEQLADANRRLQSAQSEIVRTRMLTTVAEMAAGAAHEMNNPLAVISGRSQLLATTLSDARQKQNAQLIYEKSQQLSDMITEMMQFAKPEPPMPLASPVDGLFHAAIQQAKGHTEFADRQVEVRVGDVPPALVDPRQLGAALGEIVLNAVQATDPKEGRLTLAANFDAFGQRLVLTIADNGIGMDEHVLRHACDPFFSAKQAGRRPGMGLAKALRWIESAGGSMRLESQPNAGTRAVIVLPAAVNDTKANEAKLKQAT